MVKIQFKCKLLSDVILNTKSASEGPNKTLDFIPGGCLLGIVASGNGYSDFGNDALEVFHSGLVRFGDAHPSSGTVRSLKVPASMYYPKMKKASEICYIHHFYNRNMDHMDNGHPQQLKQCRNVFYMFSELRGIPVSTEKSFSIKSAYDSSSRKSEDSCIFGYESIDRGQEFLFEVEVDNDFLSKKIADKLCGEKHLGRSRTSQYGLVEITRTTYEQVQSTDNYTKYLTVYADGRLIFLDEHGYPTFRPTARDLGLSTGEIDWSKTQIRTFQYSPWNFHRQTFDSDRCGIEKGSVFVIKGCSDHSLESQYVGFYRNEGFGKVIYNPDFLKANEDNNGTTIYKLMEQAKLDSNSTIPTIIPENQCTTALLKYINSRISAQHSEVRIYGEVNTFVKKMKCAFRDSQFASQWGTIRSIAYKAKTRDEIIYELFEKTINKNTYEGEENRAILKSGLSEKRKVKLKTIQFAYLTHGVAAEKWKKRGRADMLRSFLDKFSDDEDTRLALINLASQMAKNCKH